MEVVIVYLYVMSVGFVMSGVLASFVQLVSGEPMRFGAQPKSMLATIGSVLLRVLAGPAILMRNACLGLVGTQPKMWFGISLAAAALWSLFSGALLIDLVLTL